jgi:hypothetical protein
MSLILGLLPAQCIGKLWLSGNQALLKRLSSYGTVRSFILELPPRPYTKWPALVQHFAGLERLSVKVIESSHNIALLDFNPQTIPKSVKWIDLAFANDFSSFFEITSPVAVIDASYNEERFRMIDLNQLLPNLTHFTFTDRHPHANLVPTFISRFPAGLLELYLPESSRLAVSAISLLPKCLHTLTFQLPREEERVSELSVSFPETLTSFSCSNIKTDVFLESLPSSLVSLRYGGSTEEWPMEVSQKLLKFQSLKFLCFNPVAFNEAFAQSLPPQLEELICARVGTVVANALTMCPRSLRRWNLWSFLQHNDPMDKLLQGIPQSLEELPFCISSSLKERNLEHLPRQLLTFSSCPIKNMKNLLNLPPTLIELNMPGFSIDIKDLALLPHTLKSLSFAFIPIPEENIGFDANSQGTNGYTWSEIKHSFSHLKALENLVISCGGMIKISSQIFNCLPASLTTLVSELVSKDLHKIEFKANGWYQTMKKLHLKTFTAEPLSLYPSLPRNLTDLRFDSMTPTNSYLPSESFKDLPRSLTHLKIDLIEILTDQHIVDLPRSLRSLTLIAGLNKLTAGGLNRLPDSLLNVRLSESKIYHDIIANPEPLMGKRPHLAIFFSRTTKVANKFFIPYKSRYLDFPPNRNTSGTGFESPFR